MNEERPLTAPHPVMNAMLICDVAIREEGTGKISLIGIYENIAAPQFPWAHRMCVYGKLVECQGDYRIRLDLVRLEDMQILGQQEASATFQDRMVPAETVLLLAVNFERPGRYEFRLYANDRWVASKAFNVLQMSPPGSA